jgi:Tfp pilus assembly protein PilO
MTNRHSHENNSIFGWLLHVAGLAVTVAVAAAAIGLLYWPINNEIVDVSRQIDSANMRLQQQPEAARHLEELQTVLAEREQEQAELEARVPDVVDESGFLRQLAELARSTGTVIGEYSPGLPIDHGTHGSLEISLKLHATYADACRFLEGLKDLPRLCRAKSMEILAPEAGNDDYLVEMTLLIYYRTPNADESEVVDG